MLKNENANLIPNHFLDHNLCFRSPKWKWKHIFNIFHFKNFPMVFKKFKWNKFCTLKSCPKDLRHVKDYDSSQSWNHHGVLGFIPMHFHHFWECVCLLKHFPNPIFFTCFSIGYELKARVVMLFQIFIASIFPLEEIPQNEINAFATMCN
jgi:hypothetical protein